jgi:AcrR family transcriptional regulator
LSDQRPYAALLAKGADRRQRIVAVAQQLLTRNGWRNTSLGEIARGAGITTAGLLHHFESKEQLLHAVLDARDMYDDVNADVLGDVPTQVARVAARFERAPDLVGTFVILLIENLEPDAPLRERLLIRYRSAVDLVAEAIRRGQRTGRYRADLDPHVKAVEIIAFVYGMETSWLFDPSIPLNDVFKEYSRSLAQQFARPPNAPTP